MILDFSDLLEIEELISKKKWFDILNKNDSVVYDVIIKLFENMKDSEEYQIVKILIEKYILISNYENYARSIARSIETIFSNEKIILIPVSSDSNKIKSGHNICYEVAVFLDNLKFKDYLLRERISDEILNDPEYYIIAVDDFIGSGTQARNFFKIIGGSHSVPRERMFLFSLAAMARAKSRIEPYCYAVHSEIELKRAISDYVSDFKGLNAGEIYDKIESRLVVSSKFKRGFGKSEAIISLKRTPNNTLPIFWSENTKQGDKWPAIFPR